MIPDPGPIRVALYGDQYAAVTSPRVAISATGRDCLRTLAGQLLAAGFDPERKLDLYRAGERIGGLALRRGLSNRSGCRRERGFAGELVGGTSATAAGIVVTAIKEEH